MPERMLQKARLGGVVLVSSVLLGCSPLPSQPAARGLYADLHRAVEFRESSDWVVDRLEVEHALEAVMESVCRSEPEAREDARLWIASEIEREGGASEGLYAQEGLSRRVKRVRRMERVLTLLEAAEHAAGECPYWIEADGTFRGIESDEGRFVIFAETRGGGALLVTDGEVGIGGGGGGRLLLGRGFGPRLTLGVGFELGVDGRLPQTPEGRRTFEGVLASSVPLLVRFANMSRVVDLELAWTQRYDSPTRHGFRVGIGYGLTTPRVSGLKPYGVLWIGYGVTPPSRGEPADHTLWLGTRVGFDWDP